MAAPQPLPYYLRVEKVLDKRFNKTLLEASQDASKAIGELMQSNTFGNRVRAAQMSLIRTEVLKTTKPMWGELSSALNASLDEAAAASAKYDADVIEPFWNQVGVDPKQFTRARLLQNYDTIDAYRSRTANGIPLSQQVYKTQALADGLVDRAVNSGILNGRNAREIAKDVKGLINPDVPGGVSYAAKRLGRTELNNAFHAASVAARADEPWTSGIKWNLSGSHPKHDKCNDYAESVHVQGQAAGVFPKDNVPKKPHPQCLCFTTAEEVSEDEFFDSFMNGDYDDFMKDTVEDAGFDSRSTADILKEARGTNYLAGAIRITRGTER